MARHATLEPIRRAALDSLHERDDYEAGAKLDLLGRRLTVSTALFRLDRNNVKNIDPNDPTRLLLTGQQRTEGFLVSAAGNLDRRWKISGGYASFFARVTQDTASAPSGRRVGLVPRHQATLWSTYDVTSRWVAGGTRRHRCRLDAG